MKKLLQLLMVLGFVCSQLEAMDMVKDEILYINIGGRFIDTTRSTIETSGGEYFRALLSGRFAIIKDKNGRIFIDRPEEEGKLIQYFIRTLSLPKKFDPNVARSAAKYFQLDAMAKYVKKNTQKRKSLLNKSKSEVKTIVYHNSSNLGCPSCGQLLEHYMLISHLVNDHHFHILNFYTHPIYQSRINRDFTRFPYAFTVQYREK